MNAQHGPIRNLSQGDGCIRAVRTNIAVLRPKLGKEHEVQRLHPGALVPVALLSKGIVGIAAPIPQCPQPHAQQFNIKGGHILSDGTQGAQGTLSLESEQVINIDGGQVLVALAYIKRSSKPKLAQSQCPFIDHGTFQEIILVRKTLLGRKASVYIRNKREVFLVSRHQEKSCRNRIERQIAYLALTYGRNPFPLSSIELLLHNILLPNKFMRKDLKDPFHRGSAIVDSKPLGLFECFLFLVNHIRHAHSLAQQNLGRPPKPRTILRRIYGYYGIHCPPLTCRV